MLNQLKITRDIAAMETFSLSNTAEALKNVLPNLTSGFSSMIGRVSPLEVFTMLSPQDKFLREIPKHTYLDISPLTAYVPEGLNVTYLEYAIDLLIAAKHASGVLDRVMSPYSSFLARLITNKEQQLSTVSFENEYKKIGKDRELIVRDLGGSFKNGSTATETNISNVINRNTEWREVFDKLEEMSKLVMHVDRKALNKKVEETAAYLEQVMSKVKRGELENVSPEVVRNMSEGAYQAASELEFFATTYYRVIALNSAVTRTLEHFKKVMTE